MGSSGSARFSDYPDQPAAKVKATGGREGVSGGSSGGDPCDSAFSTILEDFEQSDYFKNHKGVPPPEKTQIVILKEKRIIAQTHNGESIGNLPTKYSYLAVCIKHGRRYAGLVSHVKKGALTRITIDAAPQ
jgi:hypothetical protein